MKNGYETIDVRQQPEYLEMFDFAGELGERVIDAAGTVYAGLEARNFADLLVDLLGDLWQPRAEESPKDWSPLLPREVGPEGLHLLTKALKEGELEQAEFFIRDALTFAWEKALLPTDDDIGFALNQAKDWIEQNPDLGPLWEPLFEQVPFYSDSDGPEKVVHSLMNKVYWGYGMGGKPIIRFHLPDAQAVGTLQSVSNVSMGELQGEFVFLRDRFMKRFWKALETEMKNSSPDNRVSWKKQWKEELKDRGKVKAVQAELLEYLKGRRYT